MFKPINRSDLRVLRLFAGLALAVTASLSAAEWQSLVNNSPFGGQPADQTPVEAPAGQLEFRGVVEEDGAVLVNLYNPSTKTSQWIPVDGQAPGLTVNSYDSGSHKVVVTQGNRQLTLPLVQPKISLMAAAPPPVPQALPGNPNPAGQPQGDQGGGPGRMRTPGGMEGGASGPAREFIRNLPPEAQAMVEEMRRRRAERLEAMGGGRGPNPNDRGNQRPR
jgi:hypothetical protein